MSNINPSRIICAEPDEGIRMNIGLNVLGIALACSIAQLTRILCRTNAIDFYLLSPDLPVNAVTYSRMKFVTLT